MAKPFSVKGLNPTGRVVQLWLVAVTADDARKQAEEAGLRFVSVTDESVPPPKDDQPEPEKPEDSA